MLTGLYFSGANSIILTLLDDKRETKPRGVVKQWTHSIKNLQKVLIDQLALKIILPRAHVSFTKGYGAARFSILTLRNCSGHSEPLLHLSPTSKLHLCLWSQHWNFLPSISLDCSVHLLTANAAADPVIFHFTALIYYCLEFEFGIHCLFCCILMRLSASKVCDSHLFFQLLILFV